MPILLHLLQVPPEMTQLTGKQRGMLPLIIWLNTLPIPRRGV